MQGKTNRPMKLDSSELEPHRKGLSILTKMALKEIVFSINGAT